MKKIIIIALSLLVLLPNVRVKMTYGIDSFISSVEASPYYDDHKDIIKETIVNREAMTEEGLRKTVVYLLENESTLVFVGDEYNKIIFSSIIEINNEKYSEENLISQTKWSVNLYTKTPLTLENHMADYTNTPLSSIPDPNCSTYYCTKTETRASWEWYPMCNAVVGTACKPLLASPPPYGAFSYLLCRAAVIVGCSYYPEKKCVAGRWLAVCAM